MPWWRARRPPCGAAVLDNQQPAAEGGGASIRSCATSLGHRRATSARKRAPNAAFQARRSPTNREETRTFADAGGSFRNVQLNAKDCGCFLDIPQVLFEDASTNLDGVSQLVEAQLSKAVAQAIDLAALLSKDALSASGTATPQGLASLDSQSQVSGNYGIPVASSSGANGGTPSFDWYIDAAAAVAGQNFQATGHISAPRTFASLGKAKDSQLRYLARPEYLRDVTDFETNQVGTTYKKGTNTDTSVSFVGDFTQMVVGMRGELAMLRDPYTQALSRTTRLVIWVSGRLSGCAEAGNRFARRLFLAR